MDITSIVKHHEEQEARIKEKNEFKESKCVYINKKFECGRLTTMKHSLIYTSETELPGNWGERPIKLCRCSVSI